MTAKKEFDNDNSTIFFRPLTYLQDFFIAFSGSLTGFGIVTAIAGFVGIGIATSGVGFAVLLAALASAVIGFSIAYFVRRYTREYSDSFKLETETATDMIKLTAEKAKEKNREFELQAAERLAPSPKNKPEVALSNGIDNKPPTSTDEQALQTKKAKLAKKMAKLEQLKQEIALQETLEQGLNSSPMDTQSTPPPQSQQAEKNERAAESPEISADNRTDSTSLLARTPKKVPTQTPGNSEGTFFPNSAQKNPTSSLEENRTSQPDVKEVGKKRQAVDEPTSPPPPPRQKSSSHDYDPQRPTKK